MIGTNIESGEVWNPILACQDSTIKVLNHRGGILYQARMESPVMSVSLAEELTSRGCPLLCYGLKNGNIGALELSKEEAIHLWEVDCQDDGRAPVS